MIRLAKAEELGKIFDIYVSAQEYMANNGINQWAKGQITSEDLKKNIDEGVLFVLENDNGLYGAFILIGGDDPTYQIIENGSWRDDSPYLAIHRVASNGKERGVFAQIVEYAKKKSQHLRIDTHEDNKHMQGLILQNGFEHCGIIHLLNGDPRLAYEYIEEA